MLPLQLKKQCTGKQNQSYWHIFENNNTDPHMIE